VFIRASDLALIGIMVASAAYTYHTKHETDSAVAQVRKLDRAIGSERDQIRILDADWAVLTQPSRIAALIGTYGEQLGLKPLNPEQIGSLQDVPVRPVPSPTDILAGSTDAQLTGAIKP
jgi:hypothetical protein